MHLLLVEQSKLERKIPLIDCVVLMYHVSAPELVADGEVIIKLLLDELLLVIIKLLMEELLYRSLS